MGKKGVLLDNGKVAQSSMALYWKAGQKKAAGRTDKPDQEPKEEDMESRAGSAMERWKQHKEKMISKLYVKPEKKDPETEKRAQAERQQRMEEEMERDLLEKEMNKNKPLQIPGFKGTSEIDKKRHYEQVVVGNQDTNKLVLPAGFEDLTQEDIVQMLREKKAKRELERAHRQREEKASRAHAVHHDLLVGRPQQPKQEPPKEEPKEEPEEKSFFKSELLQKIERGESIIKKQEEPKEEPKEEAKEEAKALPSKFIPRALWSK